MTKCKVLLVGWDAADWKVIQPLMDAGKMPNVRGLVEKGVTGQIATLHPPLSPMLWTSIATGMRPFKHGIHGFTEPTPDGCGVRPVTNLSRKTKALWNILSQNGLRSVVIGWWPSHPAEPIDGVMVSDQYHRARGPLDKGWPLPPHTVHPTELAGTLAALRVHPDLIQPEMVEPFIPLAKEIDQDQDKRLAMFLRTLAECRSIQSAATWLLDHQPWDFFAVYFEAVDHFCHTFMRYHPPRQSFISRRDFELYRNVVAMAYQFHDEMLGELMKRAGDDTTVILMSDHGFHPDHLRPASIPDIPAGPAIEHRDYGVLAIAGPGIRQNEVLHGPSVLDIAPTILNMFGLPVGEDMDGRVLSQAFVQAPPSQFVASWEAVPGADGRHPPATRLDPVAAREAMEQMIALGYVERPDENRELAVKATIRDLQYNLGESYQDAGRHAEAHEIFSGLYRADRDEQRFAVRLFVSCQALGLHDEMRQIVDDLNGRRRALFEEAGKTAPQSAQAATEDDRRERARWRNLARFEPVVVDYLKAQVLSVEKRYADALATLERVTESRPDQPDLILQIADLHLRWGRLREAHEEYESALAMDPDQARAHIGLGGIALRRRQYGAAAHAALDALQRTYHDPLAHFLLGRALVGMKQYEQAAGAFRAAISFNPNFPEAHSRLADLLEQYLDDAEGARQHRRLARQMVKRKAVRHPGAAVSEVVAAFCEPTETSTAPTCDMPPLEPLREADTVADSLFFRVPAVSDSLIVVTGLPRSGTSLVMQMLAAGGVTVISDELRQADEDNPRGYLEYGPVKNLMHDSKWLLEARDKAIKIVAPLLVALPAGLPCRVILCERDLDEVLDSQHHMLHRHDRPSLDTPERRRILQAEYRRTLDRTKVMLTTRPKTQLLVVSYSSAICGPHLTADHINHFLGGNLDVAKMASAVDPALHRNRAASRTP